MGKLRRRRHWVQFFILTARRATLLRVRLGRRAHAGFESSTIRPLRPMSRVAERWPAWGREKREEDRTRRSRSISAQGCVRSSNYEPDP